MRHCGCACWRQVLTRKGQEFSGVKQVRNLDPDFLIEHVEKWSGLSVQVLVGLLKNDQLAIVQMASFATGLPVGLKWSGELFDKVVASRFLDQRAVFLGGRLKQAVGENLVKDQQLNWTMGCYRLLFNESGRMDYVLFVNGDKVPVGKDVFIFKNAVSLTDNYSDTSAALLQPPHEPLKLINFFLNTGLGPFKFKLFAKKSAEFDKLVKAVAATVQEDKAKVSAPSSSGAAVEQLAALQKEQRATVCRKARAKAKLALAAKAERKIITLT